MILAAVDKHETSQLSGAVEEDLHHFAPEVHRILAGIVLREWRAGERRRDGTGIAAEPATRLDTRCSVLSTSR
jgi:hypothetical protein